MCSMSKYKYILVASFLISFLTQTGFAIEESIKPLVSSELLKYADLKLVWEDLLPINKKESLERMLILNDQIYLISNKNFVLSLNRQSGKKIFNRTISIAGLNPEGFNSYNDEIIYFLGNRYIELEAQTGIEQKATVVKFSIVCPVVRNESFFYVSGIDKRLHTFKAQDRIELFNVAADNGSKISSVIADEDCVIFGTDQGNVYSMLPDEPKSLWKFDAAGAIVDQIVRDNKALYFSCDDMHVYRIDMPNIYTRYFNWKTLMPGIIQKSPRVTANMIYQTVFNKAMMMVAIDKDTGRIVWSLPGGTELLAESRGKAYCITEDCKLVVMENATGKQLYSVNFAGVTRQAVNTIDSKIYIGDKTGRVACLDIGR